jgi:hypothetical protein
MTALTATTERTTGGSTAGPWRARRANAHAGSSFLLNAANGKFLEGKEDRDHPRTACVDVARAVGSSVRALTSSLLKTLVR